MTEKKNVNNQYADVIVIGGGPAGLSVSALLGNHGVNVICLDRDSRKTHLSTEYDDRTTAISYGSRNVLRHAGVWDAMENNACPIRDIRILDGDSPVLMSFLSQDMDGKSFGFIVENRVMRQALFDRLDTLDSVSHFTETTVTDIRTDQEKARVETKDGGVYRADLVIGADGRGSLTRMKTGIKTRQWLYDQKAHVCVVYHENPHEHVAYEHFREEGPFAILPMCDDAQGRHRSAVVWSDHRAARRSGMEMSDEAFEAGIKARFPDHYGELTIGDNRATYPLGLLHAENYIGRRTALVAEAAHAMHPIAGQGLNMSLRDVAAIAELVIDARQAGSDIGACALLEQYQKRRRFDNTRMLAATDGLTRLYSVKFPPVRLVRKAGVRAIAAFPPAKRFFMGQAMGLNGRLPRFVRQGR